MEAIGHKFGARNSAFGCRNTRFASIFVLQRKTHYEVGCHEAVHPGTETGPFRTVLHAEGTDTRQITP
nr:unnamed protein product [Digitaria exilis]